MSSQMHSVKEHLAENLGPVFDLNGPVQNNLNGSENINGDIAYSNGEKENSSPTRCTTLIVTDSTIRNVYLSQLKENVSEDESKIIVRRHPGATADEMSYFIKDSLKRFQPKKLIIIGGCNDVSHASKDNKNECDIANSIMRMADEGRKSGCERVFISSVLPRGGTGHNRHETS